MSASEKRYFKMQAKRHVIKGKNNYIRLFEAIEVQQKYDEAALKKKFEDATFSKQLSVSKNYLYRLILRSLTEFHYAKTTTIEIRNNIAQIEVLKKKNLLIQARKLIKSTIRKARAIEDFSILIELYRIQQDTVDAIPNIQLLKEKEEVLRKLNNLLRYEMLHCELMELFRAQGIAREEKIGKDVLREILKSPLMEDEEKALSAKAKLKYNYVKATYAFSKWDFKGAKPAILRMKEIWEKDLPKLLPEKMNRYISILNNLLIINLELCETATFYENIEVLRALTPTKVGDKIYQKTVYYSMLYNYYNKTKQFDLGLAKMEECRQFLDCSKSEIPKHHLLGLYFNLGITSFFAFQFDKTIDWFNLIINHPSKELNIDNQCLARLLNLLAYYEIYQGKNQHLDYVWRSTYQYLKKKERIFPFEEAVLSFVKSLSKQTTNKRNERTKFFDFKQKIADIRHIHSERVIYTAFDIIDWVDYRLAKF